MKTTDAAPFVMPETPYVGLTPFGERDTPFYFGRERERRLLAASILSSRLTILYGASGVGKSSLLRAGLAADFRVRTRSAVARGAVPESVLVVCSGWRDDPLRALADAIEAAVRDQLGELAPDQPPFTPRLEDLLAEWIRRLDERASALSPGADEPPRSELLLVLDQFEEYFLYHRDEDGDGTLALELPRAVMREDLRASFLVSIREDAYTQLDRFEGRIRNLFGSNFRLEHLDEQAARRAIEGPVERYNELLPGGDGRYAIEPELVDDVLEQVRAGTIALGQAGAGTVETDGHGELRVATPFLQLVLTRLWEEERRAGSHTLSAATLERLGGAERLVRSHLDDALAELTDGARDLTAAVFHQLVTPSGTKIVHTVPDLAEYAAAPESELAPVLEALAAARILRPVDPAPGETSPRFEIFHDVLAPAILDWRAAHERTRAARTEAARLRTVRKRLAAGAGGMLLLVLVFAGLAIWALDQRREAREHARAAEARELAASALSTLSIDPERSLRLALQAAELEPTGRSETVLRKTLLESRLRRVSRLPQAPARLAVTPEGLVLAASPGRIRLLDTELAEQRSQEVQGRWLEVRADAAVAVSGRTIVVVDPVTGRVEMRVDVPREPLPVRDLESGDLIGSVPAPSSIRYATLGPGKTLLAVSDGTRRAVILNALTGEGRYVLEQPSAVTALRFGPAKRTLAVGGTDGSVRLWSVGGGRQRLTLRFGHVGHISDIAFSPRATLVATASTDGTARVWRVGNAQPVAVLAGHENNVTDVEFSRDGSFLVTAGKDATARVWRVENAALIATLRGHRDAVRAAVFVGGAGRIATAGGDHTVRAWYTVQQPALKLVRRFRTPVERVAFGRVGIEAVTGGRRYVLRQDGTVIGVQDAAAPRPERSVGGATVVVAGRTAVIRHPDGRELVLRGHRDDVTSARFSPDGTRVLTASQDHDPIVWNARTGKPVRKLLAHFAVVSDARYSPDGRWIVTAGPGKAGLWDASTGALIYFLQGHEDVLLSAAFDPTSRFIVTGGRDGSVRTYRCAICGDVGELMHQARSRLQATRAP